MKVGWQGTNDPHMKQAHGWDFNLGQYMMMEVHEYIQWLVEGKSSCLRIWVDDVIIWDYEKGWYDEDYKI